MNNKNDYLFLSEYSDNQQTALIREGLNENIAFYTIDNNNNYYPLSISQLHYVYSCRPGEAHIYFEKPANLNGKIISFGDWKYVKLKDLLVEKNAAISVLSRIQSVSDYQSKESDIAASNITENTNHSSYKECLDENHPNHAYELALALKAWGEIYGDPNSQPGSVEKLLKKYMDKHDLQATSNAIPKRIASVITPSKLKEKRGNITGIKKLKPKG